MPALAVAGLTLYYAAESAHRTLAG